MSAANLPNCSVRCLSGETNRTRCAADGASYFTARTPQIEHRFSISASPQKNDIACKIVMRELRSDDLNVESLRRARISDRQMRFVQVHVSRLHALYQRASLRCFLRAELNVVLLEISAVVEIIYCANILWEEKFFVQSNAMRIYLSKPGNLLR